MINQNLHREPVPLDSAQHRALRLALPVTDWSGADKLNAGFVATGEFGDACREYPIVFVRAGKEADGRDQIAPIAVFGLLQGLNLFVDAGGAWRARYIPAAVRSYPFCFARVDDERIAICLDMAWSGVRRAGGEGAAVFEGDGQPAPLLRDMQQHLGALDGEIQRTRQICARLLELGVLRDMQFDATLPDGSTHRVDGFLTVDDKKMQELPDALVGELHRNGTLGLVQLHWVSLGNMRRLLEWHIERTAPAAGPAAAPAASATVQ